MAMNYSLINSWQSMNAITYITGLKYYIHCFSIFFHLSTFPASLFCSLISGIYGAVVTSQTYIATRGVGSENNIAVLLQLPLSPYVGHQDLIITFGPSSGPYLQYTLSMPFLYTRADLFWNQTHNTVSSIP